MSELTRFGISLDARLLERFDELIRRRGYVHRSEAIRDLIRTALVDDEWSREEGEIVGTVTLVYDHHQRDLSERLLRLQHESHDAVLSTLHIHLDRHRCLEVLVVRGQAAAVRKLAHELIGARGVFHGELVTSTTGRDLC